MYELVADRELCKGCACVITAPCFLRGVGKKSILVSRDRYESDEEVNAAVKAVIQACPQKSVELRNYVGPRKPE